MQTAGGKLDLVPLEVAKLGPIAVLAGLNFGEYFSAWILAGGGAVMNA
jgi:hypothetical protein